VADSASSVLTVAVPWSGTVFMVKLTSSSRLNPSRAAIWFSPSLGGPKSISAFFDMVIVLDRWSETLLTDSPSLEVAIRRS
jgi:hypothetical protein